MQHKFLLRFIKQEMEKSKIAFKNNEEFFHLFLPAEPWEAYRSNVSHWLSSEEDGSIRKRIFIDAINEKLGLSPTVWNAFESTQKEAVSRGVEAFENLQLINESMFEWLDKSEQSSEQLAFLEEAKELSIEKVKTLCLKHEELCKRSSLNQVFLIELFHLMYERGAYAFVYEEIFPHLLDSYDNKVKSRKADVYASLPTPMYREAFDVLNAIEGKTKAETLDLQTAAISNIRREYLSSKTLKKDELKLFLRRLIKCYSKTYVPKEEASYYPGINLAYMVALANHIFPNETDLLENYSVEQIYKDVQRSLEKGKSSSSKDENYYAGVSEIEFKFLLNQPNVVQELAYFLEEMEPTLSQVNQTKRQIDLFFLQIIEQFVDNSSFRESTTMMLELLDSYILTR